jgi:anti-sigma B factor antagonist
VHNTGQGEPPAAEQLLTVEVVPREDAVLVTAVGEVDLMTAPRLCAALHTALRRAAGVPVVVDLTGVTLLGSNGLAALVDAARQAQDLDEPLRLVVDHARPVLHPLRITGLDHVLALYPSLDAALGVRE